MPSCFRDAGTGIWEQSQPPSAFYFLPGALFRGSALSVLPCWYLLLVFLGVLPLPLSLWSLLYNSQGSGRRPARAQWPLALPLSLGSLVGFVLRVSPPKLLPPPSSCSCSCPCFKDSLCSHSCHSKSVPSGSSTGSLAAWVQFSSTFAWFSVSSFSIFESSTPGACLQVHHGSLVIVCFFGV